jgi:hypothetical protein
VWALLFLLRIYYAAFYPCVEAGLYLAHARTTMRMRCRRDRRRSSTTGLLHAAGLVLGRRIRAPTKGRRGNLYAVL